MNQLQEFEKSQIKDKRPELRVGDIIRVEQKLDEAKAGKGKAGAQKSIFEGLIISIRNPKNVRATFTLRKVSFGIGVEKVFPLYSPTISKIQVLKRTKVRRAKLYYMRERFGKKAKMKEKGIDADTLKLLGWAEQEVQEKQIDEQQKIETEKAQGQVEEMLETENKAIVEEKKLEEEEEKSQPKAPLSTSGKDRPTDEKPEETELENKSKPEADRASNEKIVSKKDESKK